MSIRDRIVELRRVRADTLVPNPRNWRLHPEGQRAALCAILSDVGYADALLARQLDDGRLELIDGHLRAETTPDETVPVLVLDVNEAEADKLLATLDPLAAMAETDQAALASLLERIDAESDAIGELLDTIVEKPRARNAAVSADDATELDIPAVHQVIVDCQDEAEQRAVYEALVADGRTCRLLVL